MQTSRMMQVLRQRKNPLLGELRGFSSVTPVTPVIDVHTHMYTPKYMKILKSRTEIPKVLTINGEDRLVILPGEEHEKTTHVGRPIGKEYWSVESKLQYMKNHQITTSVISLANPWLDFAIGDTAVALAQELNDELQQICENSNHQLYGLATLPIRNPAGSIQEIERIKRTMSSSIKGVILGTPGAGKGLDHDNIREVLHALAENDLMVFLHPHYGVGNEHFHDAGHALFLALGFPFETTVAISRLIVSGRLDEIPNLKILIAHAGAALPSLIGRLDSCVEHDIAIANRLHKKPTDYLKSMYFDAVSYSPIALESLINLVGADRIMFGTDNPFFPPLGVQDIHTAQWPSTVKVHECIGALPSKEHQQLILYQNAKRLLGI